MTPHGDDHGRAGRVGWPWKRDGAAAETRRQEALVALQQLALEGADSKFLIEHAATVAARILDVPYSAVFAWDAAGSALEIVAGVGWRVGVVGRVTLYTALHPEATAAWRDPEPVCIDVLAEDPRLRDVPLLRGHEVVSGLSVMIAPLGRPYGVLAVYDGKHRKFAPEEIAFLKAAGKVLAITLAREYGERALFEEMQMSTVLAHVGRELMSCSDVPVLLERVCRLTGEALRCDHSVTWLRRQEDETFRCAAGVGLPESVWESLGSVVLPSDAVQSVLADLVECETVRIEARSPRHPFLGTLLERSGVRTALVTALRHGEQVVGIQMSGHRTREDDFSAHDQRVASGVAQLASVALMNARVVEELERASQLKSEFVSTMSHELRTPLNIIIGYTDMLRDTVTSEEQGPLLMHVRKASQELLEMIDGTLNLNRLAAGGDVARFAPVIVAELWRELQDDFDALTYRRRAALHWEPCEGVELETDRRKLKIVLKNLVGNALKFTPTGEIRIRCTAIDGVCQFVVRDTGVGIPADALPHVFDMFRQADSSETRSYNGAGLGLYIVRTLLTQLGGTVEVESKVGEGSAFTVTLPVVQPKLEPAPYVTAAEHHHTPESAPAAAVPPVATASFDGPGTSEPAPRCAHVLRQRLLFADDLPLNRLLIERFVTKEFPEVEVVEACDGAQAVKMYESHRPDIVVLDLHMPELNGWQAATAIRQCEGGREVPLLALSVDASPLAESNALRAGFREFIAKPISDYSALRARLSHWLAIRAAQKERLRALAPQECDECRADRATAGAA